MRSAELGVSVEQARPSSFLRDYVRDILACLCSQVPIARNDALSGEIRTPHALPGEIRTRRSFSGDIRTPMGFSGDISPLDGR